MRVVFLMDLTDAPDALARVLCPFTVLQAELVLVEMRRTARGAHLRLEADGLDPHWARILARRLEHNPQVLSISLGWRSGQNGQPV